MRRGLPPCEKLGKTGRWSYSSSRGSLPGPGLGGVCALVMEWDLGQALAPGPFTPRSCPVIRTAPQEEALSTLCGLPGKLRFREVLRLTQGHTADVNPGLVSLSTQVLLASVLRPYPPSSRLMQWAVVSASQQWRGRWPRCPVVCYMLAVPGAAVFECPPRTDEPAALDPLHSDVQRLHDLCTRVRLEHAVDPESHLGRPTPKVCSFPDSEVP